MRRVPRRVLIPLPDAGARRAFLDALLSDRGTATALSDGARRAVVAATEAFSCADLRALAEEAALAPLRALGDRVASARPDEVRPVSHADFSAALSVIKPSADASSLAAYDAWAAQYGTRGA